MQIRWIEDFLTLADAKGFAKAAQRRNVSQPTFSRHIQSLEEWIGVEVIDRRVQGVQLTPSGRIFREFAIDMLRRTYDMRALLRGQTSTAESLVRFSVAHTLSVTFFPQWLNELKAAVGNVLAHVNAVNVADGARALTEGATDLLIVYHHPQLPVLLDPKRFPHLTLSTERMAPFSAPLPGGAPKFKLPGRDGSPVPFLSYSAGTYLGQVVETILLNAGEPIHLARSFDTHMAEALKAMVLAGHGLGWLPRNSATREVARDGWSRPAPRSGHANWKCVSIAWLTAATRWSNESGSSLPGRSDGGPTSLHPSAPGVVAAFVHDRRPATGDQLLRRMRNRYASRTSIPVRVDSSWTTTPSNGSTGSFQGARSIICSASRPPASHRSWMPLLLKSMSLKRASLASEGARSRTMCIVVPHP